MTVSGKKSCGRSPIKYILLFTSHKIDKYGEPSRIIINFTILETKQTTTKNVRSAVLLEPEFLQFVFNVNIWPELIVQHCLILYIVYAEARFLNIREEIRFSDNTAVNQCFKPHRTTLQ